MIKKQKVLLVLGWAVLFVERIIVTINTIEQLSDANDFKNTQQRKRPISLQYLTQINPSFTCPGGLILVQDQVYPKNISFHENIHKIPLIVHQTSKTRCLAPEFASLVDQWKSDPNIQYYFHDDESMHNFMNQDFPEFPTLSTVLSCIISPTLKADLWRYLLLWEYGGIYADLDTLPNWDFLNGIGADSFLNIIHSNDYGFLVVDHYHYASQYFMAMAPRHILMYYTIQTALSNILLASDTGKINPARTTGPSALHAGLQALVADAGINLPTSLKNQAQPKKVHGPIKVVGPITAGIYPPPGILDPHMSVRVAGTEDNQIVRREGLKRGQKNLAYQLMGMRHFSTTRSRTNISCLALVYDNIRNQGNRTSPVY
eukprot:CAMPEP_0178901812 /NCGR_PEP_ID=MMETSP0786-20121207/4250_1 /TAXON_ID=186022 /ORGANISM="Thalassionema frauenfeldii, Strain CCMP 1798" /LENGTH=372 /DNA_ID=CAMNT_0020572995 /DNA_START=48 /DNA_END=1166 /DNA_ORIENTATION=-